MLALVFSDLHIHNYKEFSVDDSRLDNCLDVIRLAYSHCKKHDIKLILFGGDLYHNQKLLPTKAVNKTLEIFKSCIEDNPDVLFVAITGNHDLATKNLVSSPGESALSHLQTVFPENFKLIDNATLDTGAGVSIHGIPYYEYKEDFEAALKEAVKSADANQDGVNILMVHQTPDKLGNDLIPCDLEVDDPRFQRFDYVYCGHIHNRAQLSDNFLLVGNPQHKDASDEGKEKGFILTDLEFPNDWRLVSTKGRYPEYVSVDVGDVPEGGTDYFMEKPAPIESKEDDLDTTKFNTSLEDSSIVRSYWEEVDGKDEDRLKIGLKLLNNG